MKPEGFYILAVMQHMNLLAKLKKRVQLFHDDREATQWGES